MRELKFRAWDGNMMLPIESRDVDTSIQDKEEVEETKIKDWDLLFDKDEEIVVMQYSGLKDKNGKEMYEGDIVNLHDWGNENYLIGRAEVIWDKAYCKFDFRRISGLSIENDNDYDKFRTNPEVIGNVYENPELLVNKENDLGYKETMDKLDKLSVIKE